MGTSSIAPDVRRNDGGGGGLYVAPEFLVSPVHRGDCRAAYPPFPAVPDLTGSIQAALAADIRIAEAVR